MFDSDVVLGTTTYVFLQFDFEGPPVAFGSSAPYCTVHVLLQTLYDKWNGLLQCDRFVRCGPAKKALPYFLRVRILARIISQSAEDFVE